jgi:hypothetical protein
MKYSKSDIRRKFSSKIRLRFDDNQLTSFVGLVIFHQLFRELSLRRRLTACFSHRDGNPSYSPASIVLLLIVSILLWYRRLRDVQYFRDDPMALRILGVSAMPTVSTISRHLSTVDDRSIERIENLQQFLVLEAIERESLARITLDFDGSVLGTCRHAEGLASGFNRKKKGQRSYYPLYCTVAQTAQVLAVKHRSGNVHDSNGAEVFIQQCVTMVRARCPTAVIETRMDGAFFSENIIRLLDELAVEYTISVPFERYLTIKCHIEQRKRWRRMRVHGQYFEKQLSLKSWSIKKHRFLFVRQRCKVQNKEPIQLDLFIPDNFDYQYKAVITNKSTRPANVVDFHEGRGTQEGLFAQLKSQAVMGYIPCKHWNANKLYLLANVLVHNLTNELQMRHHQRARRTTVQRPALWVFRQMDTLRKQIIQRAGRVIRPQGVLTLAIPENDALRHDLEQYLSL